MGIIIVYFSGDFGVEYDGGGCFNFDGLENNGNFGIFVLIFFVLCFYVLVVVCVIFWLEFRLVRKYSWLFFLGCDVN